MTEPTLVIHGVNTHDAEPFKRQVDQLQGAVGAGKLLIPVHWGELGGQSQDLTDCLPVFEDGRWGVRADDGAPVLPEAALRDMVGSGTLDNEQRADIVAGGLQPATVVRSAPGVSTDAVRATVAQELAHTRVLQHVDDPRTLEIVGRAIDSVLAELPASADAVALSGTETVHGGYAVRSEEDTRALLDPIRRVASRVLNAMDEALGQVLGNQLGRINQAVRERLARPASATLGDIMSYQRNAGLVQARLRAVMAREAPGCGTRERPIGIVAHSLGGVIAFDGATHPAREDERLWIKSFVTFGSQAAFFHIVDPRVPSLPPYRRDQPVPLPPSIGRWVNLWDPLDPLAFTAGTVFRLADGSSPADEPLDNTASELFASKFFTHSIYWASDELRRAIRRMA